MPRLIAVAALPAYRLRVAFDDGLTGEIDLADRLYGPVFEPLRESAVFDQVDLDEFGAVSWPNGADLAPDAIYQRLSSASVPR